jgi:topoisomerase IA-like protein
MAKRVKKQHFGSYVTVRMYRIDLSKDTTEEQIKVLEKHRPELLEDEPNSKRSKTK